jgi:hypothetical protein
MTEILYAALITAVLVGNILLFVDWIVDISMTKTKCKKYGWASYRGFVRQFKQRTWKRGTYDTLEADGYMQSTDIFDASYIHLGGGIFRFSNVGMLFRDPISHLRAKNYIKRYIKNYNKPVKEDKLIRRAFQ